MSNLPTIKNPKLQISNHFDSLIRELDIFTEEQLNELDPQKLIEFIDRDRIKRTEMKIPDPDLMNFETFLSLTLDDICWQNRWNRFWMPDFNFNFQSNLSKNQQHTTRKQCDFLSSTRDEILAELDEIQKEVFKRYEAIRKEEYKDMESITERVFEKRFAFLLKYENYNHFKVMNLIELDFYLNPQLLRYILQYIIFSFLLFLI